MRCVTRLAMMFVAVGAVAACSTPDQIITAPDIPTAGVRFINAVPDTNNMDFRFIDLVENSAHYKIGFRNSPSTSGGVTASTQIEYKNTQAGSRHLRIFLNDTLQSVASTILKDTTVTIQAGKLYTAIMYGSARAGNMKFLFLEENIPDPGSNVGLRVLNTTTGTVEVRTYPTSGVVPAAATFTVPTMSFSAFVNATPGQIRYNVQPPGGGTTIVPDGLALIGAPATVDIEGVPGTTQAGSAVTAIIFPPSTPGSKAVQFAAPGMSFMWDKRAPRPAGV